MAESIAGAQITVIERLIALIQRLRGNDGCPWDKKQTPISMARYIIEETYELVDAIVADNTDGVCEETGDVLFQLFFIIHLFGEARVFDLQDVVEKNLKKMINRHPHVFGDVEASTPELVSENWQKIKLAEKGKDPGQSILDSVPKSMPPLLRAAMVSERAAKAGFDWDNISGVMAKTMEEWEEFSKEVMGVDHRVDKTKASMEFGDILFSMVNVARFAKIDLDVALLQSTQKFERRFRYMEAWASESGRLIDDLTYEEMHRLWEKAKNEIG